MTDIKKIEWRLAVNDDMQQYFDWANDPDVRLNSFKSKYISIEEHKEWFKRTLDNPQNLLLIFFIDDLAIGQTRFQSSENKSVLNYSIDKGFRGKQLSSRMIDLAISILKQKHHSIHTIIAKVKKENTASIKALKRCNFEKSSDNGNESEYQLHISV